MERREVRRILMQQTRRLPNREKCSHLTEEDFVSIRVFKLDYKKIEEFLATDSLELKKSDLTNAVWFKLILFFILQTEWLGKTPIYYPDEKIWDMSDKKTAEKVAEIKRMFLHSGDLATIKLVDFLAYAKADLSDL